MIKKAFYLSVLSLLLLCAPAMGAAPKPAGYNVLFSLDASEAGRFYRVRLTERIFEKVNFSYEEDIAVFDASGDLTPFFLRKVGKKEVYNAHILQNAQIPFFPLPEKSADSYALLDVTVKTERGGRVVEVRERERTAEVHSSGKQRYLLDLTQTLKKIPDLGKVTSCILTLSLAGSADIVGSVNIYGSQDLKKWELLSESEPLMLLMQAGERLESPRNFAISPHPYVLLQMEGIGDAVLKNASVDFFEKTVSPLEEDSVSFKGSFGANPRIATYIASGVFPAERVNARPVSPGLYPASISTRRSGGNDWVKLVDMVLFLTKTSTEEKSNFSVNLTEPLERRQWAISFDKNIPSQPPTLELFWQPREVIFLAQGPPPYMIAVGRKERGELAQNPRLLKEALRGVSERDILESKAEEIVVRNHSVQSVQKPKEAEIESKPWQQYLIWAVFLLGALMLSWMAFSLLRKKNR